MKRRGGVENEVDEQGNTVDFRRELCLSAPNENNSAKHIYISDATAGNDSITVFASFLERNEFGRIPSMNSELTDQLCHHNYSERRQH